VRDAGSRETYLVVLSDMLQSGACVTVVGGDATSSGGVAVREFWKAYLEASGATLPEGNYRLLATDGEVVGC